MNIFEQTAAVEAAKPGGAAWYHDSRGLAVYDGTVYHGSAVLTDTDPTRPFRTANKASHAPLWANVENPKPGPLLSTSFPGWCHRHMPMSTDIC